MKVKLLAIVILTLLLPVGMAHAEAGRVPVSPTDPGWDPQAGTVVQPETPGAGILAATVYVDDDTYDEATCTAAVHTWGVDCTNTVQGGISLVDSGGTINVAAGAYTEIGQIVIGKSLSIVGAGAASVTIQPAQDTGNSGDARGWWLVGTGYTFNLSGVTLDGSGKLVNIGILSHGAGTIDDIVVQNIYYAQYVGRGIAVYDAVMTVNESEFYNIERIGIYFYGTGATGSVASGNTYVGKGAGEWLDYAIEVEGGAYVTISNNIISDCGSDESGWASAGILVTTYFASGTGATITGNTITNSYYGICVGYDGTDTSSVVAHGNSIYDNLYGLWSTAPAVDAENNWWGSATGPTNDSNPNGTGDVVSDNVNFLPWLDAEDGDPTGPVHCDTPDDWYLTIQAGIDGCDAGGTVSVAAGLYVEDVSVSKSITLLGPKSGVARNTGSATDWTSYTTAGWTAADAIAAGEAVIRSAAVVVDAVVDIADDCDVTVKGFVIEARNRTDSTNAHLIYADGKNSAIQTVIVENNIIGPVTGDAQDGNKGRFGLAFDSQSGGNNGLAGLVKGNKILGAEGNGANVFIIGSHYNPSMSDYSGMVIEGNDVYGSNRAGMELAGGIRGLTVRNNTVIYNGLIWNGTTYVQSARSAAAPNNILFGAGINLIRTGTICDYYTPDLQNAIENLVLSGNTIAFNEKSGVYVDAQQRNVTISANVITDNGRDGIWLDEFGTYNESKLYNEAYGYVQDVSVLNNTITGADAPYVAVRVTGKPPALAINENNLSGNNKGVVQEDGVGQTWVYTADASANWWGDATPAGVAAEVGADVDYTPWLATGTDTSTDPGFQGDFSTLWVDDDSPQTGTTGRIQEGIDLVSGSTVNVVAGTYVEDPVIDKAVTLLGPNAAINPNTGTRVAEAVILPAYSAPDPAVCEQVVYIEVSGVTIKGFTFDGDNPALHSGIDINGADVDACILMSSYEGIGNIVVENNILKNATYAGMDFYNYYNGMAATSGNYIRYNRIDGMGEMTYGWGRGIVITRNFYADVTDNVITHTRVGLQVDLHNQTNPGTTGSVKNNQISTWLLGLFLNQQWTGLTPFVIQDNAFTAENYSGAYKWNGILVSTVTGTANATINNNTITIPSGVSYPAPGYTAGYNVWNVTTTAPLAISGGTVTGGDYGVFVNNWEGYSSNGNNTAITIDGVTVLGSDIAGVYVKDSPSNTNGATVYANIQNCTIDTDATGILVDGTGASAKANYNKIAGNPTAGVTNNSGVMMDADLNWWGVPCGPSNAGADSVSANVDYTPWWADEAMTIQGPGPGGALIIPTGATTPEAQAILDCAAPGSIIKFESGSYPGGLFVNNSQLTLQLNGCTVGAGSPAFTIVGDDEVIQGPGKIDGGGGGGAGILVQAGADNFILDGVQVTGWANGVELAGDVTSFKIVNNWIHSNTGHGLLVDADVDLDGVVTIEGNLFKVNGGNGIQHNGNGTLPAEYNSWGDIGGYATGDGIGGDVDADPFTYVESFFDVWPDTLALERHVPEGTSFNVALKADAVNVAAISFGFTYDSDVLTLNSATFASPWVMGSSFCLDFSTLGNVKYVCTLLASEWTATAGTIATFNFTAPTLTDDNPVTTYLNISHLEADTSAAAIGGQKVFVNNAGFNLPSATTRDITDTDDGRIIIERLANYTGLVDLQGRVNDSGATVEVHATSIFASTLLAQATSASSGAYTTAYTAGNWLGIGSIYWFQVDRDLYLPTTVLSPVPAATYAHSKALTVSPLAKVLLLGGDASNDETIQVNDLTCIGGSYGGAVVVCGADGSSDVNGDGKVNVQDLSMAGGNLYKNSSPWTP